MKKRKKNPQLTIYKVNLVSAIRKSVACMYVYDDLIDMPFNCNTTTTSTMIV